MKARAIVSISIFVVVVMIFAGSIATGQDAYLAKEDEELFGTWINTDYDDNWRCGKIVFTSNNMYEEHAWSYSELPGLKFEFTTTSKWTDSDGNTFYKLSSTAPGRSAYFFSKINANRNIYEDVWSTIKMPTAIDTENVNYRIYYRQE